jgi:glycosyltransferase involved in cell wall biosynthesis
MPAKAAPADEKALAGLKLPEGRFFLYQGAVNEGRSFETLIPAMKHVDAPLVIAGTGNFFEQAKAITRENQLESKIFFTGMLRPETLRALTLKAFAGITVFESFGMNQYYSLANRFFDYIQAGIPQVCVDYPEYAALNQRHEVALMIGDVLPGTISAAMNKLLENNVLYSELSYNCKAAADEFCWEQESEKLISTWRKVLP